MKTPKVLFMPSVKEWGYDEISRNAFTKVAFAEYENNRPIITNRIKGYKILDLPNVGIFYVLSKNNNIWIIVSGVNESDLKETSLLTTALIANKTCTKTEKYLIDNYKIEIQP